METLTDEQLAERLTGELADWAPADGAIVREAGQRGAALAVAQVDRINEYISTCQVGITMASIGIGALGEPAISHMLEPVLGGHSHEAAVVIAIVVAYLMITSVHIVAGEIVPKLYAIDRAEGVARLVSRPLQWFRVAF